MSSPSRLLMRFLTDFEQVFNVGQLRRSKYKQHAEVSGRKKDQSSNFFDSNNREAKREREHMASECLETLISWLKAGGNVGIHGPSHPHPFSIFTHTARIHRRDQQYTSTSTSPRRPRQARTRTQAALHRISLRRPCHPCCQHCCQGRFWGPRLRRYAS